MEGPRDGAEATPSWSNADRPRAGLAAPWPRPRRGGLRLLLEHGAKRETATRSHDADAGERPGPAKGHRGTPRRRDEPDALKRPAETSTTTCRQERPPPRPGVRSMSRNTRSRP